MASVTNNARIAETASMGAPSFLARRHGRMLLVAAAMLSAAAVGGCAGRDNQPSLEARMAELKAEKQTLADELKNLQTENAKLKREAGLVKKELADLTVHTDKVRQLNAALLQDTQALRAAFEKLKAEHEKLLIENIQLKKELSERGQGMSSVKAVGPRKNLPAATTNARPSNEERPLSPCEAINLLVQRSEAIARNYKGDEQKQRLRTLRAQFQQLIKNAPADAADAVNAWLKDLLRLSSDPLDAATFPLLARKNAVLKACIKKD
ncbi:MAG: hypothetical protein ACP5M0_05535 [Desulfomonilaceae bacterium]